MSIAAKRNKPKEVVIEPPASSETVQMQRFHATSRPNKIAALEIGDSDAMAVRIDFDTQTKEAIDNAVNLLKSNMGKAADTAAKRSGNKYITEIGKFFTRSGDIVVVSTVTRMA